MSHIERKLSILNTKRIVYSRLPITDEPSIETKQYMFFSEGTHECYTLFSSRAKITTYKSLKWHLLVLWYLNQDLTLDEFVDICGFVSDKNNGFTSFSTKPDVLSRMIYEVSMIDLSVPPKNQKRKVIFKLHSGLTKGEKLSIVGKLIGRSKTIDSGDIYECMIDLHDMKQKITIRRVSELLGTSMRTIHRNMPEELKIEKELLNKELKQNEKI